MKRILILALLSILYFALSMNAQYINPPQHKIYTYTDTTFTSKDSILISASLPQFKINDFILGWHWAYGNQLRITNFKLKIID